MLRLKGGMASPGHVMLLLAASNMIAICNAGPLGPLPNATSADALLKEGSCSLGDVVYMAGDELPGSSPCERCTCADGGVQCTKQRCEPRPGCKALHRPDQCCPTYQCECEQEGRVYGNGEKLVDPADPCRVCYCQGGEVVCRRIACFVRDDCRPRLVPGRCCPEYDNCPLRGVTAVPGVAPSISSISNVEDVGASAVPATPKENIKQEITIKEITPVSEIPVITDVKIKEILPSSSIEVAEFVSSKSPLIPREATSERSASNDVDLNSKTEHPVVIEDSSSSPNVLVTSLSPEITTKSAETYSEIHSSADSLPSKISLSTQDSINSEIYPSNVPSVATMGSSSIPIEIAPITSTTKAPVIEEEDTSFFDHNPAFPPLPDDFSVLSNHEDDIVTEQNLENDHVHSSHQPVSVKTVIHSTEAAVVTESSTAAANIVPEATSGAADKELITSTDLYTDKLDNSSEAPVIKDNSMLNLRSAIPTEILNVPSSVPEDITGELDDITEITTVVTDEHASAAASTTTESTTILKEEYTRKQKLPLSNKIYPNVTTRGETGIDTTTQKEAVVTELPVSSSVAQEQTTSSIFKSNIATEVTSHTELSSLPIETSDQNPHETSDNIAKDTIITSTLDSVTVKQSQTEPEDITISTVNPIRAENKPLEKVSTTEFILTSFGDPDSTTDAVELIKVTADNNKNAAIIETTAGRKNNVLTELINLVGDVASMSDHTEGPVRPATGPFSDSEELIPVNAGYKSKNNNWNLNSITEMPIKSKNQAPVNKQKIVEIEDDESDITDSPPPNDKVEPTTRRPIIDNVSDDMPENKTEKKDIEIITQSYVPTISRRPTKVVMKKNNVLPASEETATEGVSASASSEVATEDSVSTSSESGTTNRSEVTTEDAQERIVEYSHVTSNDSLTHSATQ